MTPFEYFNANPDATAADYNNRAEAWQAVPSHRVLAWMGEAGRLYKLKQFAGATTTDAPMIGLQSAVKTVLLAVNNPNTELLLDPTSPHRVMLGYLVAATVLTQADADALVARGKTSPDITDADVVVTKAAIAAAAETRRVSAVLDAARDAGAVTHDGGGDRAAVRDAILAGFDAAWPEPV